MATQLGPPASSNAIAGPSEPRPHLAPPEAASAARSSSQGSPRISPLPSARIPDVEKAPPSLSAQDDAWTLYDPDLDPDKDEHVAANSRALSILLYLSAPCFLFSLALTLWTITALLSSTFLLPLALLRPSCFRSNLAFLLAPALRLHLAAIHAPVPAHPPSDDDALRLSTLSLTAVLLLSPLVAGAVAVASWTAGFFWFFACVVGNPEGPPEDGARKERRSRRERRREEVEMQHRGGAGFEAARDDGRASVLWVRRWWKAWLMSSYQAK